ncbi:MAG: ATP-grasp domain-containing protein, partial [candidate division Zixibacteria bacterium]|nr:ATP-grasp domain-containing protein [candidate division Zixibacteria bacterium]
DRNAVHTSCANEAIYIGESTPSKSYLDIEKIITVAKECDAEAIHPGYGFLSENSDFARACEKAGIVFIGPSGDTIELMGDKIRSREAMIKANVPVIPGAHIGSNPGESDAEGFRKAAEGIGYPVLVKASAGGGGKGMRRVDNPESLAEFIEAASREATKAFGDGTVYLEKFLVRPRHIEFQILGDRKGNIIHLFERECSIQRRHQKIIEETPSPAITSELREKMGAVAVKVASAANYYSTGTVEFLLNQSGEFYFLEMNTRLQVEHPITEMITGLDLVAEQIRIASGEEISSDARNAKQVGHAIECRIYAEDAENNFFPATGEVLLYEEPSGAGVRVDSGIKRGSEIGIEYDPILSKVIAHGDDRETARLKMIDALERYTILGVKTPIHYLIEILKSEEFKSGQTHTSMIDESPAPVGCNSREMALAVVAASVAIEAGMGRLTGDFDEDELETPWDILRDWRMGAAV